MNKGNAGGGLGGGGGSGLGGGINRANGKYVVCNYGVCVSELVSDKYNCIIYEYDS